MIPMNMKNGFPNYTNKAVAGVCWKKEISSTFKYLSQMIIGIVWWLVTYHFAVR